MTNSLFGVLIKLGAAGGVAFGFTLLLTPIVRSIAVSSGWISRPTEDRWGRRVVARLGGVAIFIGFIASVFLWIPLNKPFIGLLIGLSMVFALGLSDDLHRMRPYTKLLIQLMIGCIMVSTGLRIELQQWFWLSVPISVLWFVLIMNAFNLLDNMDGLAAGVGAIAAAFLALHAGLIQQWDIAMLATILCGSCCGFLWFNFPPAKIFMGDSGSHFIGFALAALSVMETWHSPTRLLSILAIPSLVLAVPIFDTFFVTIQRLANKQHPFVGGQDHVSHRLAFLGLSPRQTVLALCSVSAAAGVLSLISLQLAPLATIALWLIALTMLAIFGRYLAQVKVYRKTKPTEPRTAQVTDERGGSVTWIETMLLHKRRLLEILVDFSVISSAYVFAYLLRFEGTSGGYEQLILKSLPIILVVKLSCLVAFRVYQGVWRYASLHDLITIFKATTLGSLISAMVFLFLWRFEDFSRAVFIIDWMLSFFMIGGSRVAERLLDQWTRAAKREGIPVLIIGAGDTGERVLRCLRSEGRADWSIVGLIDDDPKKRGNRIHGCVVLGGRNMLPDLLRHEKIGKVFIALNDPPGELLQYVQGCCEPLGIHWKAVTAGLTEVV